MPIAKRDFLAIILSVPIVFGAILLALKFMSPKQTEETIAAVHGRMQPHVANIKLLIDKVESDRQASIQRLHEKEISERTIDEELTDRISVESIRLKNPGEVVEPQTKGTLIIRTPVQLTKSEDERISTKVSEEIAAKYSAWWIRKINRLKPGKVYVTRSADATMDLAVSQHLADNSLATDPTTIKYVVILKFGKRTVEYAPGGELGRKGRTVHYETCTATVIDFESGNGLGYFPIEPYIADRVKLGPDPHNEPLPPQAIGDRINKLFSL